MANSTTIDIKPKRSVSVFLWAMALFVAISRFVTCSPFLPSAESVNFAFALRHFDLAAYQPPPPGNPVYFFFTWVCSAAGLSEVMALVAPGILSSALAVFPLYYLARRLFGIGAAAGAVVLYAVNPAVWMAALKPLPYALLLFPFFFSLRMVLRNLLLPTYLRKQTRFLGLYAGAICMGLMLGIAAHTAIFFISLFCVSIYGLVKLKRSKILFEMANGIIAGIGIWAIPYLVNVSVADLLGHVTGLVSSPYVARISTAEAGIGQRAWFVVWNLCTNGFAGMGLRHKAFYALPLAVLAAGLGWYLVRFRLRLKYFYLPVFFVPYLAWVFFFGNLFATTGALLLVPGCIVLISAGLDMMHRPRVYRIAIALLACWCAAVSITRVREYKRSVSPSLAVCRAVVVHPDDRFCFFGGASFRLFQYYFPDCKGYGIAAADELTKPLYRRLVKNRTVYITSEIPGVAGDARFEKVAGFSGNSYLYGATNAIDLYRMRADSAVAP
ncbi:MAG: hypothetical protein A2268_14035 [Candidatus Raymondbacteria bacterium RifOxyA12_full_50_37]|uniref:Glycosyltransferase RgtA/B/C/D-like domain-containing protein n=1 Tax=Candidatus Raymondbacteria bacterium RIFOXYD12_FULL_49_13 TaxID=1817890 RepID=A0A1F7FKK2_UNCRA|nr:MAG: hypothetical protein A2268_14035 [Candidatus Raymondbacteria bacterium RifOxyA12_full_50_37]OGJ88199.1 MAG: hypothetical protein A2248_19375 [Candidatus Raymondbacteria bacterium RIFOXYA2_FULL_49_16]OGJ93972.1 MAG: hypothetical protein A2487_08800 [Candidatus Raymondbacteria bacterium RifOxyC12_full_50_8]OGJ94986.1 MAG: hypothetical protein A2350_09595 [Candidatus Raymondbacteria bacterium RifOxyB12_full_50_8]OGK07245.1 MAG: hypothetical protein A2519_14040 [Candidatus Raymondbacteria b